MSLGVDWLEPATGNEIFVPDIIYSPGTVIQYATCSAGPERQIINSSNPEPIDGLRLNFTPKFKHSIIIIDVQIHTNARYVSNWSIYKNNKPTADLEGISNNSNDSGTSNLTTYIGEGSGTDNETWSVGMIYFDYNTVAGLAVMYDVRAQCHWSGSSYALSINNTGPDNRAGFSHMTIMEVAQ